MAAAGESRPITLSDSRRRVRKGGHCPNGRTQVILRGRRQPRATRRWLWVTLGGRRGTSYRQRKNSLFRLGSHDDYSAPVVCFFLEFRPAAFAVHSQASCSRTMAYSADYKAFVNLIPLTLPLAECPRLISDGSRQKKKKITTCSRVPDRVDLRENTSTYNK